MDANQVILSVLTKHDLFYLKNRYLQMRKNARAATGCRNEREHLPFVILSLADFCSSIKLLFLVAIISITANAVFHDEVLKSLIIAGITLILSILAFLYAEVRLTRFPAMLIFKMLLIRIKCLNYKIPVPQRLPDDWEIYPI
ncbi:hypothetical protein [Citrobacter sp. MNAZ 1397]|uniref:hypothetical protein n=1 Tax=Citrobacter sp. MNAZ 1397 TaxID=2911205 RepID=UPI0020267FF9|nr:hypothetical protein [Citrobacter sp. MNAZ 1397]MCL9673307.1 hypothetical protein [Citrobacter sp. MNAZ 1397]